MNDSLRTDVFLRYNPETIACACIFLSARQLKIPLPNKPAWYSLFRVSEEDIRDICLIILRLYKRSKPLVEKLEKRLDELKAAQEEAKMLAKGLTNLEVAQDKNGGFSPSSRSNSPGKGDKTNENATSDNGNETGTNKQDGQNKLKDSASEIGGAASHQNSSGGGYSREHSQSPVTHNSRKSRGSPANHKDSSKSRHRASRSRSRSADNRNSKKSHHHHHHRSGKRNRSRSSSHSRNLRSSTSPSSRQSRNHKKSHKDKSRYRSQSRDRSNYRSRSRSYDKHNSSKSKKSRVKDVGGRHRSRSHDRSRSRDHSRR